jgi:phosphoglycolate phosphatase
MKNYECVIWDWNGTLLDDIVLALSVVNEVLSEYGVSKLTRKRYREIFDFPVRDYYIRAGVDLERHDFREISEKFCSRFEARLHSAEIFASARPLLDSVRKSGRRQFVLSGTEQQALRRMMDRYDVAHFFDDAQGLQDNLAAGKMESGRQLVQRFRIDPKCSVVIGDTTHDAVVANALGMDCLLLTCGHHSYDRLAARGVPLFESLESLSVNLL